MDAGDATVSVDTLRSLFAQAQGAFRASFEQLDYQQVHQLALQARAPAPRLASDERH